MKKVLKVLLVLVILVVALVVVAWLSLDHIVKAGVEKGGTAALKVPTTLDLAAVHVFGGEIILDGLNIANPKDFTTAHLMKSGKIDVAVDIKSLTGSTVRVSKFVIDGLDVCIEQKGLGTSNVSVMMDNLKPAGGGTESQQKETAKESSGKKNRGGPDSDQERDGARATAAVAGRQGQGARSGGAGDRAEQREPGQCGGRGDAGTDAETGAGDSDGGG